MADSIDVLSALVNPKNSAIQLYRADFSSPHTIDDLRLWLQKELDQIQSGFSSTDEVIQTLAGILRDVLGNIDTGGGSGCEPCTDGQDGTDGRGVRVYDQINEPTGAEPGDIWIKRAYV